MFNHSPMLSFVFPAIGGSLMLLIALKRTWFEFLSVVFAAYAVLVLFLTA
jgi:hypothetical protein